MTQETNNTNTESRHTHNAFRVEGTGKKSDWIKVASVFSHSDGKGFDLVHQSLTETIRIVIREKKDQ